MEFAFRCNTRSSALALVVLALLLSLQESIACERVVSLAPSISEVMRAVGRGDRLVGVSRFDRVPSGGAPLPHVGGYLDPNYEQIVLLKPDLVLLLEEHSSARVKLEKLGIRTEQVEHRGKSGILQSISQIGGWCDAQVAADTLLARLRKEEQLLHQRVRKLRSSPRRRKVLVLLGDSPADLRTLFVSGADGFYADLLQEIEAENVYQGVTAGAATLSAEGLYQLDPDTIIQIGPPMGVMPDPKEFARAWSRHGALRAVKRRQVYFVNDEVLSIPGPRYVEATRLLAEIIYPGLKEEIAS